MLIFVPSISAETCIETPPWTKHQTPGWKRIAFAHCCESKTCSNILTRVESLGYSRCSLCSNPARNQRFINDIETSQKRSHTASCSNIKAGKSSTHSDSSLCDVWRICSVTRSPGPQQYACSTLLVRSVVVISDVTWRVEVRT